jgi:ribbon-helix-helix CopG family protein
MQKTTVYLDDEEVDSLRRLSEATGRSQSELIREGVRHVVRGAPRRAFHSLGRGHSGAGGDVSEGDTPNRTWNADQVYARSFRAADGQPLRVAERKGPVTRAKKRP